VRRYANGQSSAGAKEAQAEGKDPKAGRLIENRHPKTEDGQSDHRQQRDSDDPCDDNKSPTVICVHLAPPSAPGCNMSKFL